jgi:NAD(P)-dependent dehydrogenase (short-subunit alcohol dehydrogenase family)
MSFTGGAAASSPAGWAVVIGASSGLGREFALALGERGYQVLAVARRRERLRALADEVEGGGGQLDPLVADLSTSAGIDALLARAAERRAVRAPGPATPDDGAPAAARHTEPGPLAGCSATMKHASGGDKAAR